jgi:DNA-binding NarL/FixJ family response regulator
MRVVIVGPPRERERLRRALGAATVDIVGEALTLEAARAIGTVDAYIVAGSLPRDDPSTTHGVQSLTAREIDVLRLLGEGLSNKSIAARLGISDQTVKFHVAAIGGKLGARNRTDAVLLAVRRGIIDI